MWLFIWGYTELWELFWIDIAWIDTLQMYKYKSTSCLCVSKAVKTGGSKTKNRFLVKETNHMPYDYLHYYLELHHYKINVVRLYRMLNVKSPWEALILIYSQYNQIQSIYCSYRRTIKELLSPKTPLNVEISRCVFNGEMFQWVPWPALPSDTWTSVRQPSWGSRERWTTALWNNTQVSLGPELLDRLLWGGLWWNLNWHLKRRLKRGQRPSLSQVLKRKDNFFRTEMSDSTLLKPTEQEKVQAYWDADLFIVMYDIIS